MMLYAWSSRVTTSASGPTPLLRPPRQFAHRSRRSSVSSRSFHAAKLLVPKSLPLSGGIATTRQLSDSCRRVRMSTNFPYRHPTFDVVNRVYIVTGGARGLGLSMSEALAENGAHVHCFDILSEPGIEYQTVASRISSRSIGSISYSQVDVTKQSDLEDEISGIADRHKRLDGLAAAAGIQYVRPALEYPPSEIDRMLSVNFKGVYLAATACARQMIKYGTPGAILLVGSTSGINAIKGFRASVYSSSKGAVIQLARSLSMEWGKAVDGQPIRVNALCPGNIITPMVRADFEKDPSLRAIWERENMLGRLSEPDEYKGATLFLLSNASSFMTGASLVIDGGYTAW